MLVKDGNPAAIKLGCDVSQWIVSRGGRVYADDKLRGRVSPAEFVPPEKLIDHIDVMVVLGGDGTMLYAARLIHGRKIPILGINLGGLGFLTAITVKEVYALLERILRDDYKTEERMMLSVELAHRDGTGGTYTVLNDAIIKGTTARLISLETRINREYVTTYRADGLIISSPTGSTAYSLSANGPILYPTIHSIIVAPICPFNLTNRPVVIPDWMSIEVTLAPSQTSTVLVLDGQVDVPIGHGDHITVKRADASVDLVKYEGKSYFDILRERLMWEVKIDKK